MGTFVSSFDEWGRLASLGVLILSAPSIIAAVSISPVDQCQVETDRLGLEELSEFVLLTFERWADSITRRNGARKLRFALGVQGHHKANAPQEEHDE